METESQGSNPASRPGIPGINRADGMIPICGKCRRVRDDQDRWFRVEESVLAPLEPRLTHGFCPDCSAKLLADMEE